MFVLWTQTHIKLQRCGGVCLCCRCAYEKATILGSQHEGTVGTLPPVNLVVIPSQGLGSSYRALRPRALSGENKFREHTTAFAVFGDLEHSDAWRRRQHKASGARCDRLVAQLRYKLLL